MASERRLAARTAAPRQEAGSGMSCVVSRCGSALQDCVMDPTCLRGLGCFVACSANPSRATTAAAEPVGEGACQVRCVDLYESDTLNAFTRCTLTENGCYPALAADPRYPPLPSHLAITTDPAQLRHLLTGRWYVSAGLNPAFDAFACQIHDFTPTAALEEVEPSRSEGTATVPIADATFSYRVALDARGHKFVKRVGQKRLYLKRGGTSEPAGAATAPFRRGRAWGRHSSDPPATATSAEKSGAQLALTTVPDYMDYEDEWTILSASSIDDNEGSVGSGRPKSHGRLYRGSARTTCTEREAAAPSAVPSSSSSSSFSPSQPSTDYMVVAYRGSNSAWRGYGGLNVYTREPVDLSDLTMRQQQHLGSSSSITNPEGDAALLRGIQRGLDKVGLTVADLLPVDHASGCDRAGDGPGGTN